MSKVLILAILILGYFSLKPSPTPPPSPIIPTPTPRQLILDKVPFTSQAPNYDWKDPRLQDGCEEASVLMAYYWVKKLPLNSITALKEILAMVDFQKEKYGEYRDTSLNDSANRLLLGYFSDSNYKLINNITLSQIVDQLYLGNLIIVPMNGQLLHNPNYTGIGPERHMMLIIGYDPQTKEFITNDAGTWKGASYRFPEDVLFNAIRDYSTGYHIPITQIDKNMLVIESINSSND